MSELVRKNIRMSKKTAEWYEEKAKEMGVSQSNLMAMALADYIRQEKAMESMGGLEKLVSDLKNLKTTE